ncbi:MAG: hypothetical protein V9E96_17620 [Chitinophagaceae bacterium]
MQQRKFHTPIYKTIPVLRLLLPLIIGILLQFHLQITVHYFYIIGSVGAVLLVGLSTIQPTIQI